MFRNIRKKTYAIAPLAPKGQVIPSEGKNFRRLIVQVRYPAKVAEISRNRSAQFAPNITRIVLIGAFLPTANSRSLPRAGAAVTRGNKILVTRSKPQWPGKLARLAIGQETPMLYSTYSNRPPDHEESRATEETCGGNCICRSETEILLLFGFQFI